MHKPPTKSAASSLGAGYTIRSKYFGLFVVLTASLLLFATQAIFAASVTEGYNSSEELPAGTVVSISQDDPSLVERTNLNNSAYIAGVTANVGDGLVEIGNAASQVFVAVSGDSAVLVSTEGGTIQKGDLLGPSAISGVAQKIAVNSTGRVLGVALGDFDGTNGQTRTVNGKEITIGLLDMQLLPADSPGSSHGATSFLERVGIAVTGSEVSVTRVLVAGLVFITVTFIAGVMLYGSIKGTFQAIGRNPMASKSIYSSLIHVTLAASTILLIGLLAAYLVMVV